MDLLDKSSLEQEFNIETVSEAESLLADPCLLYRLKRILDLDHAGQDNIKLRTFLMVLSGKLKDPKEKKIINLLGDPGGGKSDLANAVTQYFRTKKRARFSEHGLDYSDLENFEILYLQELFDMDENSRIRLLSGDDEGYEVEVSERNEESKR